MSSTPTPLHRSVSVILVQLQINYLSSLSSLLDFDLVSIIRTLHLYPTAPRAKPRPARGGRRRVSPIDFLRVGGGVLPTGCPPTREGDTGSRSTKNKRGASRPECHLVPLRAGCGDVSQLAADVTPRAAVTVACGNV